MASVEDNREADNACDVIVSDEVYRTQLATIIFSWRPTCRAAAATTARTHWMSGPRRASGEPTPS